MRRLLIAAALFAATPAMADGIGDILRGKTSQTTQPKAPGTSPNQSNPNNKNPTATAANTDLAKISVDVAVVEVQASKLYLAGLADLASRPGTWDKAHTIHLFNEAQRSLIRAEQQLGEMEQLATGQWANAADPIRKARSELVTAEHQLRGFAEPVRSGQAQPTNSQSIKDVWNSLDRAQKDVESAAGTMGVPTKLQGL